MALPEPVEREAFHRRRIEVEGYRRSDGLWDIEARLVDTKTYAFDNGWRGEIRPGEPLHDMWLRVTIDDAMAVRDVVAVAAAHPFRVCPEITGNFRRLIGETLGAGWRQRVRARLGGVEGCTHLVDLLDPVATVAFQTLRSERARALMPKRPDASGDAPRRRPAVIDTCHAMRADGEVVREFWPAFYTGGGSDKAD
ncbi:MAG TPA: DUF2889 domain-containing protein [Candidatus Sulfotelmatobacter sp.]|nr:DUF2889 domain-containing protein [Candidatus Sulfotelmatobacter sp.]